ncbi:MAG: phosphatase PAP2 family protein [Selenomonadaceae bacterium]|nr:phosphatase PAP2 family protein [Selenomonadaceae bacterium]
MDILSLDKSIMLFVQEYIRCDAITLPVIFITHLGDKGLIWIVLVGILLALKNTRQIGKYAALSLVLCGAVGNLIKNLAMRPRPFLEIEELMPLVTRPDSYSFPSMHTACAFAVTLVALKMGEGKWRYLLLTFAVIVSLSRIYVGVHYTSDVLAGFLLGALSSYVAVKLAKKQNLDAPSIE